MRCARLSHKPAEWCARARQVLGCQFCATVADAVSNSTYAAVQRCTAQQVPEIPYCVCENTCRASFKKKCKVMCNGGCRPWRATAVQLCGSCCHLTRLHCSFHYTSPLTLVLHVRLCVVHVSFVVYAACVRSLDHSLVHTQRSARSQERNVSCIILARYTV